MAADQERVRLDRDQYTTRVAHNGNVIDFHK
jgi:hypothetical protein